MKKQVASDRILQGPDGVCSAQTTRDIKFTIQTPERISSTLEEISLLLPYSLDLKALTTLVRVRETKCRWFHSLHAHRFPSANKRVSQAPSLRNAASYTTLFSLHTLTPNKLVSSRLINSLHAKACQKCISNKTTAGLNGNMEGRV